MSLSCYPRMAKAPRQAAHAQPGPTTRALAPTRPLQLRASTHAHGSLATALETSGCRATGRRMDFACNVAALEPAGLASDQPSSGSKVLPVGPARGTRAVVIGTGMAGLAAARILADALDEVIMLERDGLPFLEHHDTASASASASSSSSSVSGLAAFPELEEVVASRRGVPQFQQPHVMLARGLQELDELFPGFKHDLEAAGAVPVAAPSEVLAYDSRYGRIPHEHDSVTFYGATRALVETMVRHKFAQQQRPNVQLLSSSCVTGLRFNSSASAVTGVDLTNGQHISADLVVDASGRGSKCPQWLAAAGHIAPEEMIVNCQTTYYTATYTLPPEALAAAGGKKMYSVMEYYPGTKSALLVPVEGGKWQMILATKLNEQLELTDEAVMKYMESLGEKLMVQLMASATRVTPLTRYSRTENFRRLYEKCDLPDGLAIIGDSACAFNPIYGQGMTTGILQARALGQALSQALNPTGPKASLGAAGLEAKRAALSGVSQKVMKQLGGVLQFPWSVATGADAPYLPGFKQSPLEAFISGYFDEVLVLGAEDPEVYDVLTRVIHMQADPGLMFSPKILAKVLAFKASRWFRLGSGAPAAAT